ncbi:MAG: hypothetical protein ABIV06_02975, partial [Thermoanaerobaculia bacterium]
MRRALGGVWAAIVLAGGFALSGDGLAAQEEPATPDAAPAVETVELEAPAGDPNAFKVRFGFEGKAHYRDSESFRIPSPFPFPPESLPPGATQAFLETVNEGGHFE